MITPISELVRRSKCFGKLSLFLGNTIVFGQNSSDDWTVMDTIKWPIISIAIITVLTLAWQVPAVLVLIEEGKYIQAFLDFQF